MVGKTKVKLCTWCNKEIDPLKERIYNEKKIKVRGRQATMHLECAKEKASLQNKRSSDKIRFPKRKERIKKEIERLGIQEELKKEIEPEVEKKMIRDLSDPFLYVDENIARWTAPAGLFEDIKRQSKKRKYGNLIKRIKENKFNSSASS